MARDRRDTEGRLLSAAERMLTRSGFATLGVNAVAAEAGVDKVLIYRYFGGLPELLARLARDRRLWPEAERAAAAPTLDRALLAPLLALARELRDRPLLREAVARELAEANALTAETAAARERETARLLEQLRARFPVPPFLDLTTLFAILAAGIAYLGAHRDDGDTVFALDLQSDATWRRIEKTLAAIVRTVAGSE
jgi:AcrR family transcriptional regulator